jgi:hypothetical protein
MSGSGESSPHPAADTRAWIWSAFGPQPSAARMEEVRQRAVQTRRATSDLGRCYPASFDCYRVLDDLARHTVQLFRVLGVAFLAASRG